MVAGNVQDIRKIPDDKEPSTNFSGDTPSSQSGVVQLICKINRRAPFNKSADMDDVLVFNSQSTKNWGDMGLISTIPGTEGLFLTPMTFDRHNFLAHYVPDFSAITDPVENIEGELASEDIKELPSQEFTFVNGEPVYKKDQRWIISPSLFNKYVAPASSNPLENNPLFDNCYHLPVWRYEKTPAAYGSNKGDTPENNILIPVQQMSTTCNSIGIHWGLRKETKLFKGEDFFVRFYRKAEEIDVPDGVGSPDSDPDNIDYSFNDSYLEPLNVRSGSVTTVKDECGDDVEIKINAGVVEYDDNNNPIDEKSFDFIDQAYYIIHMGIGTFHEYFLLITQRSAPRLVRIEDGRSIVVSDFTNPVNMNDDSNSFGRTISGNDLISADWFQVMVRNHLGHLAISFETSGGIVSNTWVVRRFDLKGTDNDSDIQSQKRPVPVVTYIPESYISLYGGNLKSGFMFGPVQYKRKQSNRTSEGNRKLTVPPPQTKQSRQEKCNRRDTSESSNSLENEKGDLRELSESEKDNRVALPLYSKHFLKLTSTDESVLDLIQYNEGPEQEKLFTQDANLFVEEHDGEPVQYRGSFFKRDPIKASQPQRGSEIRVRKGPDRQVDQAKRVELFRVEIELVPGNHEFDSGWVLEDCKTPIMTMVRLVSESDGNPRWESREIDVSEHVLSFNDSWSAQDFSKIEHTGNIQFLLNRGAQYFNDQTDALHDLVDKAFYIEIWAGYRDTEEVSESRLGRQNVNYSRLSQFYKLFTGICFGGNINTEMGRKVMDCQILDYMKVLEDNLFFNSPFFDGVRDWNAVKKILDMASFRDQGDDQPGSLIRKYANSDQETVRGVTPDGRPAISSLYVLPSSYSRLQNPFFKFDDGKKFSDGITEIAERGGKVFFFDAHGIAHFDSYFDYNVIKSLRGGESAINDLVMFRYTTNPNIWSGQIAHNAVDYQRTVTDVFNHVKIMSNTPDFNILFLDDVQWDQIDDPTVEGFIGYMKSVFQREGVFGSLESSKNVLEFYKAMQRPPLVLKFESWGLPVRSLDLIYLNNVIARVMKVDTEINPSENLWWNTFECEWLFPVDEEF